MSNTKKMKPITKDNSQYWIFLALPMIVYVLFFIIPNLKSIYMSVFEWDGLSSDKIFVGLNNFVKLFTEDPGLIISLKNTLLYTIIVLVFQNIIALLISILIYDSSKKSHSIYRTIIYMPYMLSSVAVGFIWTFIYDPNLGVINKFFAYIGWDEMCKAWLGSGSTAIVAIAIVHIWFGIGQAMILFIAGLQQIPNDIYEAANIDGCNNLKKFFYMTLPLLKSITLTITTLTIIGCFKSFDFVYVLTGGGADGSSSVLALKLYKEGFKYSKVGYSSAISVILLITVSIITLIQFKLFKEKED